MAQLHLDVDHGVGTKAGGADSRIRFHQPELPGGMKAVMLAGQSHLMEWPADDDRLKSSGCSSA